ncbi:hypothetical protein TBR22_A34600 [Luteitalea sp. TBR-22]|uniref:hybrid sensor histidine kinase/response regulator n=1 Tax=Luteitalea sp. TBR-22 TaxID=2802971 RepID=UPI001AF2D319|nr:PAS domain-containing sensor histidine kinase [Luteitalea sp. TBR-22]BCS34231.1 hypothetical protein TBR22_A34600 [Luteitalea sp. TBR-22]
MTAPRDPLAGGDPALAWLTSALRSAPTGFALVDIDFRFLFVNQQLAAFNGVSVEAHLGRTVADVLPMVWPHVEAIYRHVAAAGESVTRLVLATETRSQPGTPRDWLLTVWPVTDEGRVTALGVELQEVTAQVAAERELQRSEERFRTLVNATSQLVWVSDEHGRGRQVTSSPEFHDLAEAQASGEGWLDLVHPDDRPAVLEVWQQALSNRQSFVIPFRLRRRDDTWAFVTSRATPVTHRDGTLEWVGTVADESERRRWETAVEQVQRLEAVGRLAGGVAHDFNNLLTIINGYTSLLALQLPADDERSFWLAQVAEAGERAAQLTEQLLAFSRRQPRAPEVLDLNERVRSLERLLLPLLGADVSAKVELAAGPMWVMADRRQIDQVLLNLCVNARDAMPGGGVLGVATRPGPAADEVEVVVTDTGTGIPPDVMPHIFEPFFTTKEPGKGTGLGLSMVFGIVKQNGGRIAVDSEPGRGASFRITLPAATSTDPSRNQAGS